MKGHWKIAVDLLSVGLIVLGVGGAWLAYEKRQDREKATLAEAQEVLAHSRPVVESMQGVQWVAIDGGVKVLVEGYIPPPMPRRACEFYEVRYVGTVSGADGKVAFLGDLTPGSTREPGEQSFGWWFLSDIYPGEKVRITPIHICEWPTIEKPFKVRSLLDDDPWPVDAPLQR